MTLKKEIAAILHPENKMYEIAVERLHPPIASEKSDEGNVLGSFENVSVLNSSGTTDSKLAIDWKAMSDASEFRRFVYWIRTGQVFRGSNNKLDEDLWKTQDDINMVRELKRIDPNASNFGDVMKEYKDKVRRLREK